MTTHKWFACAGLGLIRVPALYTAKGCPGNAANIPLRSLRHNVITVLCSFLFFHLAAVSGFSSDRRLLQLVPPGSQVVAGILSSSSSFLLITYNNEIDHKDFFALTGGDQSREIHEIVFVAEAGADGIPGEHTLLVSGHFDRDAIFRFGNPGSATRQVYRGVAVLVVQPFARELESFKELRWLVIPDGRIAIFGSVPSVQRELDRWIANSPTDPELLRRLGRLDLRDETWCLLPSPRPGGLISSILGKLDARLEALANERRSIQYGVHVGKDVEITASNNPGMQPSGNTPGDPLGTKSIALSHLLSGSGEAIGPATVRLKIPRRRYDKWLAGFSKGGPLID